MNNDTLRISAHSLGGLSANIGAIALSKIAKDLEDTLNKDLFDELYVELNKIIYELQYISYEVDASPVLPLKTEIIQ